MQMNRGSSKQGCVGSPSNELRQSPARCLVFIAILISWCVVLGGCHLAGRPTGDGVSTSRGIRAIWVTRWDYKSKRDIKEIIKNSREAGFNTVLFQVRGNGTVCYKSKIEPWADELGGRNPGFDPLKVAIKEAHRRGMELHAWVNVMPGWRGDKPPANPRQLYHTRPQWFWLDEHRRRQPLGWYQSLNPCYPEVRNYLVSVMQEIVSRYRVDGLHLDYIRFPNEWNDSYPRGVSVPDYPRDPRTLAMFKRQTGHTPRSSKNSWDQWRTDKVTLLVRSISSMIKKVNPRVRLSAAVGAVPEEAKRKHFQDARRWIAMGLLDAVYPMNYIQEQRVFAERVRAWSGMKTRIPIVMGVMFDKRSGAVVTEQINTALRSTPHFAGFAYNSLFERLDARGRPEMDEQSPARAALRKHIMHYVRRRLAQRDAGSLDRG